MGGAVLVRDTRQTRAVLAVGIAAAAGAILADIYLKPYLLRSFGARGKR